MAAIDVREENDPLRDASRPYGQASADANALRALNSIGGGGATPPIQTPDAQDRNRRPGPAPLVPLRPLVSPGTPIPYSHPAPDDSAEAGGLGQQYPFMSSSELVGRVMPLFPAAVQAAFKNRKIDRPSVLPVDAYGNGKPATAGGYYDPATKSVVLARGNNKAYDDPNVDVGGAMHEILHAIAYEGEGFAQDREAGYAQFRSLLDRYLPTIVGNPQTSRGGTEAANALKADDGDHAFTAIGTLYVQGAPLPSPIRAYFDQMKAYRPMEQGGETTSSEPDIESKPGLARGAFNSDDEYRHYVTTGDWRAARPEALASYGASDPLSGVGGINPTQIVLGQNPFGRVLGGENALRVIGAGQSAFDILTVHADKLIPGPGQNTIGDRFDAYRRAGMPIDKAANQAMADYGDALQEFAETPGAEGDYGSVASRAVAQGARVVGAAQNVVAPAPLPGGASLPIGAGLLRGGAKAIAKSAATAAVPAVRDGAEVIAERIVAGVSGRAAENAKTIGTAGETNLQRMLAEGGSHSRVTPAERAGEEAAAAAGQVSTNQKTSNALLQKGIADRTAIAATQSAKREDVWREIGANLDKFGMSDDLKNLVMQNAAGDYDNVLKMSFADQRRGVMTIKEIMQNAADKVPSLDMQRLAQITPGTAMNGETLLAVGMALNKTAEDVKALAHSVTTGGGTFEEKAKLIVQTAQMNALQRVFAGGRTEWGRTGVALQQIMNAAKTPKDMYDAAAKFIGGTDEADQFVKSLDALWNRTGISTAQRDRDIFKFVSQLDKPGRFAWIPELWRNSILSNPITHEVNTIGNAMLLATETVATRTAAAGVEAVRAGFGLRNVEREVYFSEVLPSALAALKGVPDGLAEGLHIVAHGVDARDVTKFVESGGKNLRSEAIRGPLGAAVNAPTRLLAAADAVFDQMAYKAELTAQAARGAAKEGLRGNAFKQRMADLLANPTDAMLQASRTHADLVTLKSKPDSVTKAVLDLRRKSKIGQFVAPFITTPSNLLKLGVAYSPLGIARAIPLAGPERALMLGRAAVGSAIMGYFATQMLQGNITAGAPSDPRERQMFYASGKQPYSIKVGDNWIQFRRLEPLATPINWTAAMFDAWQRGSGDFSKALPAMSFAIGRALLDSTYLSGMSDLVGALQDPERNAERLAASWATGFVPFSGFLRGIAQAGDPYLRDPDGLLEIIESNLPGLSGRVRPQIDITGQPTKRAASRQGLGALVNPVSVNPEVRNSVLEELGTLHSPDKIDATGNVVSGAPLMLGFPTDTIRTLGLTADESYGLNQEAQQRSMRNLGTLFTSDPYKNASDTNKRKMAEKAIADARTEARGVVAEQSVQSAGTPEQLARAVVMRLGALSDIEGPNTAGQRALYLASLVSEGKLTPLVQKTVDAARGTEEPTVAEYLRAAPKVKEFAALPPYRTGNPPEWKELEAARALRAKIANAAQTPAEKDARAIDAVLRATDARAAELIAKYSDARTKDPARAAMLKENPWLTPFVGGLDYEQVKR